MTPAMTAEVRPLRHLAHLYQRSKPIAFYRRSSLRACPGHPSWQSAAFDGRDTPGHDGVTVAGESHQKRRLVLSCDGSLLT
jgi:hypothetical protein